MDKYENDHVEEIDMIKYNLQKINARLKAPSNFDNIHCITCDEALSDERLSVLAFRCLECQQTAEKPLVRVYEFKNILSR